MARNAPSKLGEEDDLSPADKQIEDLENRKKDADTVLHENKAFQGIYADARKQLQKNGTALSEKERKDFEDKLVIANQDRDPKKIAAIQKHIDDTISETHKLTAEYFAGLDKNKELFGKDTARRLDTLQEYKDEFGKQTIDKKREWHGKLGEEVKSLKEIRDQLVKTIGSGKEAEGYMEQFNKLRRTEKKDYLKEVKTSVEGFKKAVDAFKKSGLYSDEELKDMSVRFREAPLDKQKKLLAEYEEDAKSDSIKSVQTTFKKFSPETQKRYEETLKKARGLKAKKEVIEQMKQGLRDKLIKMTQDSKYQSTEEKSQVLSIEKEDRPEMLEMFVKGFPAAEKKLMEFAKVYESMPVNVQAQYDFKNSHYGDKEKIAEDCKKHGEKIKQWNKKLEDKVKARHISEASAEKYKPRFEKLSLRDKDATLRQSTLDDPRRAKVLQRFENENIIPKEMQEKHKQFYNMRLEDRLKLVDELEKGIEKTDMIKHDWSAKLNDLVERHLLSPESVDSYQKWFSELENPKEMEKALEKSDIDNPQREKVLETFQKLPDDVRAKHENMFYQQDLTGRIETLRTLLPDGGAQLELALSSMAEAQKLTENLENHTKLQTYRDLANDFKKDGNRKAEIEIRGKIAEIEEDDEANNERLEELKMLENPDSQFIGNMLTQVRDQAGMQDELMANKIMFEIADRAHAHEIHSKRRGMESRVAANDNVEYANLSEAIYEHSEGEKMLDAETGKAIDMQVFDEADMLQNHNVASIQKHRNRFKADGERMTDTPSRLGQYGVRDKSGKELVGDELVRYKIENATKLAEKILSIGSKGQIKGKPSPEAVAEVLKAMDENEGLRLAA